MLHLHLFEFFKFYGIYHNQREVGISIRQGGFAFCKNDSSLGKDSRNDGKVAIESPINVLEDVGQGAFNYNQVKTHFKLAYETLLTRAFMSESMLKLIIDQEMFKSYQEE